MKRSATEDLVLDQIDNIEDEEVDQNFLSFSKAGPDQSSPA
jgi:hypothetical protein